MKYVSLFSGIGGFETALNHLGFECVMAAEIDKHANKAYSNLYGHETAGDVTKIDAQDVPDHDLLVGGFPCQAFSVAGKQRGFADTRGTLFFEIARIARDKKPKYLLLENVKGLLSHDKGKTIEILLQTLSDIGYTIDFTVLNSKFYGVPQNRERIFIVGVLGGEQEDLKVEGNNVLARTRKMINGLKIKTFNFPFPDNKQVTTKLRDILEDSPDEKYYISEEKTKRILSQLTQVGNPPYLVDDQGRHNKQLNPLTICPTLRAETHGNLPKVVGKLDIKGKDANKRVYDPDGLSPTLTTMEGGNRQPKIIALGNLNPSGNGMNGQVYGVDGLSPTLTTNKGEGHKILHEIRPVISPDSPNKNQNGRRCKEDGEESFTLTPIDRHGVAFLPKWIPSPDGINRTVRASGKASLTKNHNHDHIHDGTRIRKLTPLECLRLQGFPDDYYHKLKAAKISDTQLYKMAGNAVTVNVVEAIGRELIKFDAQTNERLFYSSSSL